MKRLGVNIIGCLAEFEIKIKNLFIMKIKCYQTRGWEVDYLKERLKEHELSFFEEVPELKANFKDDSEIISVFVGFDLGKKELEHFPNLKFIATRSTGFDHIDLKACAARKILVSNVPTYGENTVAEFAFTLLLALSRKLYPAVKSVKETGQFTPEGFMGFDLKAKVIGVVGTGHIGVHVVKIAKGFDMHVLAFDPHPRAELVKNYGVEYVSLEELLKQSDVVSLHVPYMPATHHLINKENIKMMKRGSLLINTARGGLVETAALLDALDSGHLAGAAMDVLEEEGYVQDEIVLLHQSHPSQQQLKTVLADHELIVRDNVIITPHTAFNTKEAVQRILDTTISNIHAFIQGSPINLVEPKK